MLSVCHEPPVQQCEQWCFDVGLRSAVTLLSSELQKCKLSSRFQPSFRSFRSKFGCYLSAEALLFFTTWPFMSTFSCPLSGVQCTPPHPPDLSKVDLCVSSSCCWKKSQVVSLRHDMQKKIWIAVTHWRRKRLLLLQQCSNTFHCENDAFMWAPNQVVSHAVTLPQERHNRFKWQALKPALVVINFKNPFTLTPCCQSINETNMFLLLYCGFWILFFLFF